METTNNTNIEVNKYVSEFWSAGNICNFTKEAVVLFVYLLLLWDEQKRPTEFYMHPASLLSRVRGFTVKSVIEASEELQERGYISFEKPDKEWVAGRYTLLFPKINKN